MAGHHAYGKPLDQEKPWLAAIDSFAIGGGAQILLVCDHVLAAGDSYFALPAANEGIVPGAANFRLGKLVGGRVARQIILGGRKIAADDTLAPFFFDQIVPVGQMDAAVAAAACSLDNPAVVVNRRVLRRVEEPLDAFCAYIAQFALVQAERLYSPDVVRKLWQ
jgi:thioesterase DpgC